MTLIWADRVRETSSTSGTGNITPAGAYDSSYKTIGSVLSTNDTAYFVVKDSSNNWNSFLGTWNGTSVVRTTILAGSNGTSAANLSGTGVEIWIDAPADWIGTRGTGTVVSVGTAGLATGGPITGSGTITVSAPSAGVVYSNGTALSPVTIGGGLQLVASTLQNQMPLNTQTGNYTIVSTDRASLITFTGSSASTITLPSASAVGSGWWVMLQHAGTGTTAATKKLSISGTLDNVSNPAVYPGDIRIILSNGSALSSILLRGGFLRIDYSDSPFSLVYPSGHCTHEAALYGAGGGGGSGARGAAGANRRGGSGGGGGARSKFNLPTSLLGGTSATVTIGAGGTGGAAPTTDTANGNNGNAGGNSTFGTLITAGGGGAGYGGNSANASGGGGGGIGGAGQNGSAAVSYGGPPGAKTAVNNILPAGGGGSSNTSSGVYGGGDGGGAGGGASTTHGGDGGSVGYGGHGGGGGGGLATSNAETSGGGSGSITTGNTTANGNGAAPRTAGTDGTSSTVLGPGTSGQGGGSHNAGGGGAGGNGGLACGGGGAGATTNGNTGGKGGDGGNGFCLYWYYP